MTHKIGMLCITAVFTLYEHNFILLEMVPSVVIPAEIRERKLENNHFLPFYWAQSRGLSQSSQSINNQSMQYCPEISAPDFSNCHLTILIAFLRKHEKA